MIHLLGTGVLARVAALFIGVTFGAANHLPLDYAGIAAARIIDVSQEAGISIDPERTTLLAPNAAPEEKLAAIDALQLRPSAQVRQLLQQVAEEDADLYVRERAIMALGQIRDPEAIPTLVRIGLDPPNEALRLAAYNTVWQLRKLSPLPDPPDLALTVLNPIRRGVEFDVEARVVSTVRRDSAQIRFLWGKFLVPVSSGNGIPSYHGPLTAGEAVVLRGRFQTVAIGKTSVKVSARINLNRVDAPTYTSSLYIDIQENSGSVTTTPFADEAHDHVLPIE
jgi:hypothetical protein